MQIMLGKPRDHVLYGWDNEYGQQCATVHPFRVSKYLVSNAEFHEFVCDDGYTTREHWSEEGCVLVRWGDSFRVN
jgi:formylglycine-generating enzyme required for sulfatase activity